MQEAIQENFILLSKIAKEKKYAQEYLGLLARRGDIGSIRIGKRWYTTWQWFEEFLENSQKRKEAVSEMQIAGPVMVETVLPEKTSPIESKEEKIKINVPFFFPEREKVVAIQSAVREEREENVAEAPALSADKPAKIAVAVKTKGDEITIRKNIAVGKVNISLPASPSRPAGLQVGELRLRRAIPGQPGKAPARNFAPVKMAQPLLRKDQRLRNISVEERNRDAVSYREMKFKQKEDIFSPDFSREEKMQVSAFSRFAFAMSLAMIFLLVAVSGYFIWSGGLLARGQVAGASDERNGGFSGIKSGSDDFLTKAGDKMKESLSVSRVMMEAAKEKTANNESAGNASPSNAGSGQSL